MPTSSAILLQRDGSTHTMQRAYEKSNPNIASKSPMPTVLLMAKSRHLNECNHCFQQNHIRMFQTSFAPLGLFAVVLVVQPWIGLLNAQTASSKESGQQATSSPSPNPKYGDDTPDSTIRSFYTALAMADRETVEYLLATPKGLDGWIDAQLDITYAFHRFSEAAKSHFGDEGKSLYLPSPALLAIKQLKEIKPKESGDKAEWTTNPRLPTKLFRKDGHWKMDILKSFEKPEHIKELSRDLQQTASYIDDIAEKMENGRFDTMEQVRAEMKRRRENKNSAKE